MKFLKFLLFILDYIIFRIGWHFGKREKKDTSYIDGGALLFGVFLSYIWWILMYFFSVEMTKTRFWTSAIIAGVLGGLYGYLRRHRYYEMKEQFRYDEDSTDKGILVVLFCFGSIILQLIWH